jgi:hypothetical protein
MNYHIDFCETGSGSSLVRPVERHAEAVDASDIQQGIHDDTSHRPIRAYASQRRCNAKQFGQRAFNA